jgi:hypothetical protein
MVKEMCQTFITSGITTQQQKEEFDTITSIATRKVTTVEELVT